MIKRFLTLITLITILFVTHNAWAFDAVVSSTSALPGDSISISLDFSNHTGGIISADTILSWDPDVLQATTVENGSNFTEFSLTAPLTNPGQVIVSQYTYPGIDVSQGQQLTLTFAVLPSALPGNYPITLNSLVYGLSNFQEIPVSGITNGVVTIEGTNEAPELNQIGNKNINEGQLLNFTITASDSNGDSLHFPTPSNLPEGANFNDNNDNTATFTWTPNFDQSGNFPVHFEVNDGELNDFEDITITVNNVNRAPVLNQIGNKQIQAGQLLEFTIFASDLDGDSLNFPIPADLPESSSFVDNNDNSGTFNWVPTEGQAGDHSVTFIVSDSDLTDQETITITVSQEPNVPPEIIFIGDQEVNEGELLEFTITATDANGDKLFFPTPSNLPEGANFNDNHDNSATFNWTPTFEQSNEYQIIFQVTDGDLTDNLEMIIDVLNINRAPTLQEIGDHEVQAGDLIEFIISATDPDGDSLHYIVDNAPDGHSFIDHEDNTATFSWTPTEEQSGNFSVTFTVSDDTATDSEEITITVTDFPSKAAEITDPLPGMTLTQSPVLFMWTEGLNIDEYYFEVSSNQSLLENRESADIFSESTGENQSVVVDIPLDGNNIYAAVWSSINGQWFRSSIATYGTENEVSLPAEIITPVPGSELTQTNTMFQWTQGENVQEYFLDVGIHADEVENRGQGSIYSSGTGTKTSTLVSNIPIDGTNIYAVVWSLIDEKWEKSETVMYTTQEQGIPAQIVTPADQIVLTDSSLQVTWSSGYLVDEYYLDVASDIDYLQTVGSGDIYSMNQQQKRGVLVENIPLTGNKIYLAIWSKIHDQWIRSNIKSYLTRSVFVLNLDNFPYYQSSGNLFNPTGKIDDDEIRLSAPASIKMTLTWLWWNKLNDPSGPPELEDPLLSNLEDLFNFGYERNLPTNSLIKRLDTNGTLSSIQELNPPYNPYHYNYALKSRHTLEQSLNDIAKWISYPAGGGNENPKGLGVDGHPVHAPALIPVGGNYDHWVVVRGIRTSANPWENSNYGIYGFWVNDPIPSGLGENTYITASQWGQRYHKPLTHISLQDPNLNRWVSILEPPVENGSANVIHPKSKFTQPLNNVITDKLMSANKGELSSNTSLELDIDKAIMIIQAAVDSINEELLPYDKDFAGIFAQTVPSEPIYVTSDEGDYFIVPFEQPMANTIDTMSSLPDQSVSQYQIVNNTQALLVDKNQGVINKLSPNMINKKYVYSNKTMAAAIIDAKTGEFKEATWVKSPIQYLPLTKSQALKLLSVHLNISSQLISDETIVDLVTRNGSLYLPEWKLDYNGQTYFINQNGKIFKNKEPNIKLNNK